MTTTPTHPARYSPTVLAALTVWVLAEADRLGRPVEVLDPFAGAGRIHTLAAGHPDRVRTTGVELEREWADAHPGTVCADMRDALATGGAAVGPWDVIATSPTYGNRMADHHEARDASRRNTYRHRLGRELTAGNSGALQWGPEYRTFHADAWARCAAVLRPGALLLVNVSDHIRKGSRVAVADWHAATLDALGLVAVERLPIPTPRLRYGANGAARVEAEELLVYRRPAKVAGL